MLVQIAEAKLRVDVIRALTAGRSDPGLCRVFWQGADSSATTQSQELALQLSTKATWHCLSACTMPWNLGCEAQLAEAQERLKLRGTFCAPRAGAP